MEITKELLQTIYDRTVQVSLAKFNDTPDQIRLYEDGSISVVWDISCCGETEYDYKDVTAEELNSDLDALIKERKEKEEIARIQHELHLKQRKS